MFLKKKEKASKKIDKLVTWVIIGSAIASIFGLSKTKKWQEVTKNITKKSKWILWKIYWGFDTVMCKIFGCKNKK